MTWGQQNTEEEGHEQMDYAVDRGVNFFDTSELYSIPPKAETQGSTETIIGTWFKKNKNRDKIINDFVSILVFLKPSSNNCFGASLCFCFWRN